MAENNTLAKHHQLQLAHFALSVLEGKTLENTPFVANLGENLCVIARYDDILKVYFGVRRKERIHDMAAIKKSTSPEYLMSRAYGHFRVSKTAPAIVLIDWKSTKFVDRELSKLSIQRP
jgi:hypothetical protein